MGTAMERPTLPQTIPPFELSTDDFHRRAVERVIRALHSSTERPLTLQEMARIAFISRYHFIRVFHRLTGIPPVRFQWATRLAYAKRLLVETDMSVIDVCLEAGYNSLGTFTRRFKELVGVPPHQFRVIARNFDPERLTRLLLPISEYDAAAPGAGVEGKLIAPPGFSGLIFVGLFSTDCALSLPKACSLLTSPGTFRIPSVPDGVYQLGAAAISRASGAAQYFIHDDALRASTMGPPLIVHGGKLLAGSTHLELRPPAVTDLPILMAFVPLLENKLSQVVRNGYGVAAAATNGFAAGMQPIRDGRAEAALGN